MFEIVEELRKWREARNMQNDKFIVEEQVAFMLDECKEVLLAKTNEHMAEEYCDIAIFAFNGLGLLRREFEEFEHSFDIEIYYILHFLSNLLRTYPASSVYNLNEIISSCKSSVEFLGYDFQKMMLEKIKVISSREQDPEQAKEWALNGASGKWEKNKLQDKATIYKPNFDSCKVVK